eukprot:9128842-Pyramimonas_sp.AAC.1
MGPANPFVVTSGAGSPSDLRQISARSGHTVSAGGCHVAAAGHQGSTGVARGRHGHGSPDKHSRKSRTIQW